MSATEQPMSTWRALVTMFRVPRRGRGFWFSLAIDLLWPVLALFTRLRFRGGEHVPPAGPVLLASNHLSFADPVSVTAYALANRRIPRYLAKASLWKLPVVGRVLVGGGHIPVHRDTAQARDAFRSAIEAVGRDQCLIFFPEGGFSDDPDDWPSAKVKNGVARVALETGAPVVPVANWGTHHLLPRRAWFPRLLPRRTIDVVAGPPVDLSGLDGASRASLDEATKRIMHAVTALLAGVRGEQPPRS